MLARTFTYTHIENIHTQRIFIYKYREIDPEPRLNDLNFGLYLKFYNPNFGTNERHINHLLKEK